MPQDNFLQRKLQSGRPVLGTWAVIPSLVSADIICSSGIDFLIIDAEHGPPGFETAQAMAIACESRQVSPVMRVGGVLESDILRALETGVHALHVPNITSAEALEKAVAYCKYPPLGTRGFSPFTRAGGYSSARATTITDSANRSVLLAVHIEGREAVENIEALLEIDGVDILFIGMYDLSKSLGFPGEVDHPMLVQTAADLCKKILGAGKYPGTIATSGSQVERFLKMGMRYITYSVDCEILLRGYQSAVEHFRAATASRQGERG